MRAFALAIFLAAPATGLTTKANNDTLKTRACQPPFNALPYCDITLPLGTRVADLIERLWANASWIPPQLTARHGGGGSPGPTDAVPELGLPEYDWVRFKRQTARTLQNSLPSPSTPETTQQGLNCIHGVQSNCVEEGGRVYCPTSFMNPVNFGSAWNKSLAFELGSIVATETRALWVAGATEESSWSGRPHVGLDCWSPCVFKQPSRPLANERNELSLAHTGHTGGLLILCTHFSHPSSPFLATTDTLQQHQHQS